MALKKLDQLKGMFNRMTMILYSPPRVGKTTALLKIPESGEWLYMLAADKGIRHAVEHASKYKRMMVSTGTGLLDVRNTIKDIDGRVRRAIEERGRDPRKIWVAVDTITHLQMYLLNECRTVTVKKGGGGRGPRVSDSMVRDAVTQMDYGINLGWMTELVGSLLDIPCNVVFTALERKEDKTHVAYPALVGQSAQKVMGDCDVIARLTSDETGNRSLICANSGTAQAGFRGDRLEEVEPADLVHLRDKFLAVNTQTEEEA